MSSEYIYRTLTFDDLNSIEELYLNSFNCPLKENFFKWKYFKNPFGNTILAGAFYENKLVGSGAMILEELIIKGRVVKVYKCTDLMTHSDHQKKGISKEVNKLLIEEVNKTKAPLSYTLCSKISTKSFLKNNWLYVNEITNYFKPFLVLKLSNLFKVEKYKNILLLNGFDENMNNYQFCQNIDKITLNKSLDYLKWKMSNPNFDYNILSSFDDKNKINGYLIFSISKNKLINIIDYESFDKEVLKTLFSKLERLAIKNKYRGILFMTLKGSDNEKFIKKKGYITNPFNKGPLINLLDLNVRYDDKSFEFINNVEEWNLNALNYDDI